MLNLSVPVWELIVRSIVVYVFLIFILRISGKRQIGQLAPFDLVLLLILSNAVQNSMSGGDNSLIGGLIIAATLVLINYLVGFATYKSKKLETLIEGRPQILIHHGALYKDMMEKSQLTQQELDSALRLAGCTSIKEVQLAILETGGAISVIPLKK